MILSLSETDRILNRAAFIAMREAYEPFANAERFSAWKARYEITDRGKPAPVHDLNLNTIGPIFFGPFQSIVKGILNGSL